MKSPYYFDEPTCVSFSGGRTSAYMLYRIIEAHGGELPDHVKVCFANTGKEMPQTLDFVQRCSDEWGVPIVWIEATGRKTHKITSHAEASRSGEPFVAMIEARSYLPNMIARFCTSNLKVEPIDRYMADIGFNEFLTVVGIRADEPRRATKMRAKKNYAAPLADAGIAKGDISAFWKDNSFDLGLPDAENNLYSNCDLCYLKGGKIKQSIIRENPSLADWWIEQENRIGGQFRSDQPSYEQMKIIATDQTGFDFGNDETISCFCGD